MSNFPQDSSPAGAWIVFFGVIISIFFFGCLLGSEEIRGVFWAVLALLGTAMGIYWIKNTIVKPVVGDDDDDEPFV